jgi:hypothetical protein
LKWGLGYEDAKNGDMDAVHFVVSRCAKLDRICKLRKRYPDAVLLSVLGTNPLPPAFVQAIGLPIWKKVYLLHTVPRKMLNGIMRLLHKSVFAGYIQADLEYILVDDVIMQDSTTAALRRYVTAGGGKVVAVVALTYAIGSHAIAPLKRYCTHLMIKFELELMRLLRQLGIAASADGLTNSQAKHLLRFASIGNILKRIEKAVTTI